MLIVIILLNVILVIVFLPLEGLILIDKEEKLVQLVLNVKCSPLNIAPQCNGQLEGCNNSQWLGGFNVYELDNKTNAILLDPICCESPNLLQIDQKSCVSERLNFPKLSFEHSISNSDFVYKYKLLASI
uniref:Uncharacterized protein n=1 Tax=Meloidogyne enterolobii TaxID=390850 RepID=A0A6V7XJ41_MELEN|nr:unnamed protein product [Meloidogyne enterolobii]